jgi:beta-lactamase class A
VTRAYDNRPVTISRRTLLVGTAVLAVPGCSGPPPAPAAPSAPPFVPPSVPSKSRAPGTVDLADLEAEFRGRIGAWAQDTGTGAVVAYRADERFPLLSTFKALVAAAVLDRGGLNRRLYWGAADRLPNSPGTG